MQTDQKINSDQFTYIEGVFLNSIGLFFYQRIY